MHCIIKCIHIVQLLLLYSKSVLILLLLLSQYVWCFHLVILWLLWLKLLIRYRMYIYYQYCPFHEVLSQCFSHLLFQHQDLNIPWWNFHIWLWFNFINDFRFFRQFIDDFTVNIQLEVSRFICFSLYFTYTYSTVFDLTTCPKVLASKIWFGQVKIVQFI